MVKEAHRQVTVGHNKQVEIKEEEVGVAPLQVVLPGRVQAVVVVNGLVFQFISYLILDYIRLLINFDVIHMIKNTLLLIQGGGSRYDSDQGPDQGRG